MVLFEIFFGTKSYDKISANEMVKVIQKKENHTKDIQSFKQDYLDKLKAYEEFPAEYLDSIDDDEFLAILDKKGIIFVNFIYHDEELEEVSE